MAALHPDLRGKLEKAIVAARDAAEDAAGAAIERLAVAAPEPLAALSADDRKLRVALRAKARQLGDGVLQTGLTPLVEEIAYEQWHRMLFARFLAENGLLRHPSGVTVSLQDCEELAPEEGAADKWELAARYARAMLPGIFREDDPSIQVRFAREDRSRLEGILAALQPETFLADDALGWVYQFWQTKKKKEVNESGRKIGGADISPVTQLFTEDYMVRFLLENSLGAWWAARHPESPLIDGWSYLRWTNLASDDEPRKPAAGDFSGWPNRAVDLTVMDPCCGSGHFPVAAFEMLRRMRMEEEGLTDAQAADAVLRDNIFGLELDQRCTQIATFAVALAAWKVGGHPEVNPPKIACSGIAVGGQLEDWKRLAKGDNNLRFALTQLHALFKDAPTLGSLIDPKSVLKELGLLNIDVAKVVSVVKEAVAREATSDADQTIFGHAALDVARAAELLGRSYTLVATNVPYLMRGSQNEVLKEFATRHHDDAKADLASIFIDRCVKFCTDGGSLVVVSPQNWLFLGTYQHFRKRLLVTTEFELLARLGAGAFRTVSGEVVNVSMLVLTNCAPSLHHIMEGLDVSSCSGAVLKADLLLTTPLTTLKQQAQMENPDARITLDIHAVQALLEEFSGGLQGIATADYERYGRTFWELGCVQNPWHRQQSTVRETTAFGGREHILSWSHGDPTPFGPGSVLQGQRALGHRGVAVSQMGTLPCALYTGEYFDNNTAVILPKQEMHLPAIWAFCSSPEFNEAVRRIDTALKVTNASLVKVPFDLTHWQKMAEEQYPNGLPEPRSDDPTQWLFLGQSEGSDAPLQVAVAGLVGYRWPEQATDLNTLDALADEDGIVCLPPVAGEQPGSERLRALLAGAYGSKWSPSLADNLLGAVEFGGKSLDEWLRDGFFKQHCRLFHNRPFIWQLWDGLKGGFSVLVNYHELDAAHLDKLIYTYLQRWIDDQREADRKGVSGANAKYLAADKLQKKLIAIREGEPPYDIYVRWKPEHEQPIGWQPDLNDGVRLNIRPFVTAGVLRAKFTVNWTKDRGTNPDGTERLNDLHLTIAEKQRAREQAGVS